MIVYGTCVGPGGQYETVAKAGLTPYLRPRDQLVTREDQRSIFEAYNSIAEEAAGHEDLEALVLLHDDLEVEGDPRALVDLLDDDIAVVGVIGSSGLRSIGWWHGTEKHGRIPGFDHGGGVHDVELIDGMIMVLSPWAVRNVRWDEKYRGFHGYEADLCSKVLAAGRRVAVGELAVRHRSSGVRGGRETWRLNNNRWLMKHARGAKLRLRWRRLRLHISAIVRR